MTAKIKPVPEPSLADLERTLAALYVDVADASDETARAALTEQIDAAEEAFARRQIAEERAARRATLEAEERERREHAEHAAAIEAMRMSDYADLLEVTAVRKKAAETITQHLPMVCSALADHREASDRQATLSRKVIRGCQPSAIRNDDAVIDYIQHHLRGALGVTGGPFLLSQNPSIRRGDPLELVEEWVLKVPGYERSDEALELASDAQIDGQGLAILTHDDADHYVTGPDGERHLVGVRGIEVEPQEAA